MKLLSTLKNQPADNCFILTYNADLAFFEYMLFTPLYISGCRNITILCDPVQYTQALEDISILRFVGQRYVFLPARTSKKRAFHPKVIFLTGTKGGSVTVTSGNLTSSGYTRNIEVFSHFRYSVREPNLTAWQACLWAYQTLESIIQLSDAADIARKRLDQLYGTTPWLREAPPGISEGYVWFIHNLNEPLLDQFMRLYEEIDHSKVKEFSIVSPFFDHRLRALSAFMERLRPNRVSIYSFEPQGLDPAVLDKISRRSSLDIRFLELDCGGRPLHAKAILLRTDKGSWAVTGSANMSAPAWLRPAESGNTEIVTVRYEETTEYFNPWFQELVEDAYSIELEDIEYREIEGGEIGEKVSFQIDSAILEGKQLNINVPPEQILEGTIVAQVESGNRKFKLNTEASLCESVFSFKVQDKYLRWLEAPSRCWVEFVNNEGTIQTSNTVLLINLNSLSRFSQPITKKPRPRIPLGLEPESYEHCLGLLGMLEDLLARNKDDLDRHQRRIGKREKEIERKMVIEDEGEYIPEDHFVEEPVRLPYRSAGEDLYVDYYDRLTYEELLSIVLRVIYHPPQKTRILTTEDDVTSHEIPTEIDVPKPIEDIDDGTKERMLARIESRFHTLVRRFTAGMKDEQYIEEVPPLYLLELYIVISHYLRIVWLDGYLSTERFLDHSYELIEAIWGWPGEEGIWVTLRQRMHEPELRDAEDRLGLSVNVWMYIYLLAKLFEEEDRRGFYKLAAWARHAMGQLSSPDILIDLSKDELISKWRYAFPPTFETTGSSEITSWLMDFAQRYDDYTLVAEIVSDPSSRAEITKRNIASLNRVPSLLVSTPLTEGDFDRCLRYFRVFLQQPTSKDYAWAQFSNINPPVEKTDINKVVLFFRSDEKCFEFVAERAEQRQYDPDITLRNLTRDEILALKTYTDLERIAESKSKI